MSVLMVLKIPVTADAMRKAAGDNGDLLQKIEARSRELGAIHHAFYDAGDHVIAVDEWDSEESFNRFFEEQGADIGQLMAAAGATGPPEPPQFYEQLSVGDEF
jgi:hypothetical protein